MNFPEARIILCKYKEGKKCLVFAWSDVKIIGMRHGLFLLRNLQQNGKTMMRQR